MNKESILKKLKEIIANKSDEYKYLGVHKLLGISFLKFECLTCNHIFIVDINTIIQEENIYCPKEYDVYPRYCNSKQLISKFYDRHPTIELLEIPEKQTDSVDMRCSVCGHVSRNKRIRSNSGCPNCANTNRSKNITKTLLKTYGDRMESRSEHFYSQIDNLKSKTFKILSKYKGHNKKILAKCLHCNRLFITTAKRLSGGSGHVRCRYERASLSNPHLKTNSEYLKDFHRVHGDRYTVLDKYINVRTHIRVKCNTCGNVWKSTPGKQINSGNGCPRCNASYGSNELHQFLSEYYTVESEKMLLGNNHKMYIDSFIPELSIGFEYDGLRWHTEETLNRRNFSNGVNYHRYKQDVAKENGIRTIHIRENEWKDKNDIVKSRILSIIGKIDKKIYARKCEVREVPNNTKVEFLNRYHIQGNDNSSIRLGLYYEGKIVSIMTFGKVRNTLSGKEDQEYETYELIRFASRSYINVVGGFSKLLKYAETLLLDIGVERIKTFADKRWSSGSVYESNGFTLSHSSDPNYIYYKGGRTYSRYEFQKHKLANLYKKGIIDEYFEGMSERECAESNGFNKVYDCGNLVYYKILI